ncbi:MAG: DEAD/DEAH box helicase [Anaerolineales bacterium]|nr:DEAD/DEAH box helicase [Anaerolineales bacterium]
MSQIHINILENKQAFSLTGDLGDLTKKRRIKIYLLDFLLAKISDDEILIPFDEQNQEDILKSIRELLKDHGIKESRSNSIELAFEGYLREEENFINFSRQALSIRNNELSDNQKIEFKNFRDSLIINLPNRRLYELQLLSSYHLAFSQNACNFSVPGAGKTSIVYASYAYLKNLPITDSKHVSKLMIIGPLSSFGPWEAEYEECFGVKAYSKRLSGGANQEERTYHFYGTEPAELSLLSYNSLPNMMKDLIFFLRKFPTMVVLDEAHKIKNVEGGVWSNAVLEIARYSSARIVLTGTPAPNGYEDIFNLFKFIWPTKDVIEYYPYQLKEMSDNPSDPRISKLVKDISPFFVRIRKSDLRLPEPIEHDPIIVEMGALQKDIYAYIEKNYMGYFSGIADGSTSLKNILTKARLVRLMQASTNPSMLRKPLDEFLLEDGYTNDLFIDDTEMFNKIFDYREKETPPKFAATLKVIKEILSKNGKVIVWTIFIQNILDFQEYLNQNGVKSKILYGATPVERDDLEKDAETRESIIREFHKEGSDFKVLIANPFAIAESISLHKACHNAIYLERSFNAGNFIQSKDRIHRYGLKDKVNYYYILSNNNIDHTIHQRLIEKEARMLKIIENEPIPLFSILEDSNSDDEDLRTLIYNYVNKTSSNN